MGTPKTPEKIKREKTLQIIVGIAVLLAALLWGILKGRHSEELKKTNIIKFANYDTDLLLQEQNAYHVRIENKINNNNSNLQNRIEKEEKTNEFLSRKLELLEKQYPKIIIAKEKRSITNEESDSLNIPSAY